jgi:hypothetical protein
LTSIPIDPKLVECADEGIDYIRNFKTSEAAQRFESVAKNLIIDFE